MSSVFLYSDNGLRSVKRMLLILSRKLSQTRQTPIMNHHQKKALFLATATLLFLSVSPGRAEETPRSAMRKGLKSYHRGDYTNAVGLLEKTVLEFPDIGNYNLGNAQYRAGTYEAAAEAYNEALRTTDLELQAKAYFNRGNALLARITELTGQDQIRLAVELAFQAVDMFEKSLLLEPEDLATKQNYERAQQLRLNLENNLGKWYFDRAESLLQEYRAKEARSHYHLAKQQFNHILENVEPHHEASRSYLPQIEERLSMLTKAVEEAESDLAIALRQVDDYQYMLAAQRLTTESDERKYAFDLKPDLKKRYEETIQKNQDVLKIIQELTTLNIVE